MSCLGKLFGSCLSPQTGASDEAEQTEKVTLRNKHQIPSHFSVGGYEEYRSQVSSVQSRSESVGRSERYTLQSYRSDSKNLSTRKSNLSKISEASSTETKVMYGTIKKKHKEQKEQVDPAASTDTALHKSLEVPMSGMEHRSSDVFVSFKTLSTRIQTNGRNATYENTILLVNPNGDLNANRPVATDQLVTDDSKKAAAPPPIPQKRHDSAVVMFGTMRRPSNSRVPVSPIDESAESSGTSDVLIASAEKCGQPTATKEGAVPCESNLATDMREPEADYRILGPLRKNPPSGAAPTYTNVGAFAAQSAEEKPNSEEEPYRRLADMKCNPNDNVAQSAVYVNDSARNSRRKQTDLVDSQAPKLVYAELDLPPTRADSPVHNIRGHSPSKIEYLDGTCIDFERTNALALLAMERERMFKSGQLGGVDATSRPIISSEGGRRFVSRNHSLNQLGRAAANANGGITSRPPMITPKRRNSEARLMLFGRGMLPADRNDTMDGQSDYVRLPKQERMHPLAGANAVPTTDRENAVNVNRANKSFRAGLQESVMSTSLPSSSPKELIYHVSYVNFTDFKDYEETFEEKWRAVGPRPAQTSALTGDDDNKTFPITSPRTDTSRDSAGDTRVRRP